jgi:tRNA uridine 5-carboxymethylaminomethyl modification enzyme
MTSRAEYRLILRQDNADLRLTEKGRAIGLVSDERWERFLADRKAMEEEVQRLEITTVSPSEANPLLESLGGTPVDNRISLSELLRRPEVTYDALAAVDPERPELSYHVRTKVEVSLKYRGYIEKQMAQIEKFKKLEGTAIPEGIDYMSMEGLRNEAREKLTDIRPISVGQASRISGVSPADINVLLVQLERMRRKQ